MGSRKVVQWLRGLGMERYKEAFLAQEITMDVLAELGDNELKELGVDKLGPRMKIVKAAKSLSKKRSSSKKKRLGSKPSVKKAKTSKSSESEKHRKSPKPVSDSKVRVPKRSKKERRRTLAEPRSIAAQTPKQLTLAHYGLPERCFTTIQKQIDELNQLEVTPISDVDYLQSPCNGLEVWLSCDCRWGTFYGNSWAPVKLQKVHGGGEGTVRYTSRKWTRYTDRINLSSVHKEPPASTIENPIGCAVEAMVPATAEDDTLIWCLGFIAPFPSDCTYSPEIRKHYVVFVDSDVHVSPQRVWRGVLVAEDYVRPLCKCRHHTGAASTLDRAKQVRDSMKRYQDWMASNFSTFIEYVKEERDFLERTSGKRKRKAPAKKSTTVVKKPKTTASPKPPVAKKKHTTASTPKPTKKKLKKPVPEPKTTALSPEPTAAATSAAAATTVQNGGAATTEPAAKPSPKPKSTPKRGYRSRVDDRPQVYYSTFQAPLSDQFVYDW